MSVLTVAVVAGLCLAAGFLAGAVWMLDQPDPPPCRHLIVIDERRTAVTHVDPAGHRHYLSRHLN